MSTRSISARHLFDTPIGKAGVAWTGRGVDRFVLPAPEESVRRELAAAAPDRDEVRRAPIGIRDLVRRVRAHLNGRPDPFTDVKLDITGLTTFTVKVLGTLRRVRPGSTVTYGELARRAGKPRAARAVGRIMGANPVPLLVPCHRVLATGGGTGGFSASGGTRLKEHLLQLEGVHLDTELAVGLRHLMRVDRRLGKLIRRFGPYTPGFGGSASWDILVTSIVHQQLSVKAAGTIADRVRALTKGPFFPTPKQMTHIGDESLRGCGLSRAKVSFIRDLGERILTGRLELDALPQLDDQQVLATLTEVKGIGTWTAQMAMIFHLGRLDVWPVGDLGLRKAVQLHLDLEETPDEQAMIPLGERWAPFRSMAAWYLWAYIDGAVI